jgi:hypothetical protein
MNDSDIADKIFNEIPRDATKIFIHHERWLGGDIATGNLFDMLFSILLMKILNTIPNVKVYVFEYTEQRKNPFEFPKHILSGKFVYSKEEWGGNRKKPVCSVISNIQCVIKLFTRCEDYETLKDIVTGETKFIAINDPSVNFISLEKMGNFIFSLENREMRDYVKNFKNENFKLLGFTSMTNPIIANDYPDPLLDFVSCEISPIVFLHFDEDNEYVKQKDVDDNDNGDDKDVDETDNGDNGKYCDADSDEVNCD